MIQLFPLPLHGHMVVATDLFSNRIKIFEKYTLNVIIDVLDDILIILI